MNLVRSKAAKANVPSHCKFSRRLLQFAATQHTMHRVRTRCEPEPFHSPMKRRRTHAAADSVAHPLPGHRRGVAGPSAAEAPLALTRSPDSDYSLASAMPIRLRRLANCHCNTNEFQCHVTLHRICEACPVHDQGTHRHKMCEGVLWAHYRCSGRLVVPFLSHVAQFSPSP